MYRSREDYIRIQAASQSINETVRQAWEALGVYQPPRGDTPTESREMLNGYLRRIRRRRP